MTSSTRRPTIRNARLPAVVEVATATLDAVADEPRLGALVVDAIRRVLDARTTMWTLAGDGAMTLLASSHPDAARARVEAGLGAWTTRPGDRWRPNFFDLNGSAVSMAEVVDTVAATGRWHHELHERHADGAPLSVLCPLAARSGPNGANAGTVLVNRDITGQREAVHVLCRPAGAGRGRGTVKRINTGEPYQIRRITCSNVRTGRFGQPVAPAAAPVRRRGQRRKMT